MKRSFAKTIIAFIEKLPLPVLMTLSEILVMIYYSFDVKHRKIAGINLDIAFPGMKGGRKKEITRESYRNIARTVAEILKIGDLDDEYIRQKLTFEGLENIIGPHDEGTGVFAVTAHFGNWELMAAYFGKWYANIDVIVRPQKESFINEYVNRKREIYGNRVIVKFDSAREVIRSMQEGRIVGVLMDQDTHLHMGVFVDFFGLPACTLDAVPRIAYATGAKIVPVFPFRDSSDKYRHTVRFYPAVNPETDDKEEFVRISLERINGIFEEIIRKDPGHWLWFHRRWRTRPAGEEPVYDI